jgi:hypothetical protein
MNYETERIWKKAILPRGTEEIHEKSVRIIGLQAEI